MAIWHPVEDGEYGEHYTMVGDKKVTVYSDRDGEEWNVTIGENDERLYGVTGLAAAKAAALKIATEDK